MAINFMQNWRTNLHSARWRSETDWNIAVPILKYLVAVSDESTCSIVSQSPENSGTDSSDGDCIPKKKEFAYITAQRQIFHLVSC